MGVEYGTGIFQKLAMSDRTDVYLTILTIHKSQVAEIADRAGYDPDWEDLSGSSIPKSSGAFIEVKWGELLFLPELMERGIPYTAECVASGDIEGAMQFSRYTENGELDSKTISNSEWGTLPLSAVESLLNDPSALERYVKEQREYFTVPSWENQEEYALKYLALQLIRSNSN